ncbi:anti-sigma factor [Frondihabitans cladoniiphilus]|uniref:Regulator of SigK n=1 Tax=Frondihabitans cladoniiphilus TaxID=715785 RepID=A0ABP8VW53_9MICO
MSDNGGTSGRGAGLPDIDTMSGAYVLDALSDEEREAFETRMSESDEIRTEVTELNDTVLLLAHAVEPVTPSAGLRSSLMDLIASTPQLAPLEEERAGDARRADTAPEAQAPVADDSKGGELLEPIPLARQRWFMRPAVLLVGAAAAVGLIFGGVGIANTVAPSHSQSQLADGVPQILSASDVHTASATLSSGGKATVYYSNKLQRSAVILDGVTALPSSKTYQLWYIRDGKAASAGTVDATSNSVTTELQGDLKAGDTIGITVEPAGGSKAPTTTPVAAIQTT